jgi:hypothetical protein
MSREVVVEVAVQGSGRAEKSSRATGSVWMKRLKIMGFAFLD